MVSIKANAIPATALLAIIAGGAVAAAVVSYEGNATELAGLQSANVTTVRAAVNAPSL